MKSFKELSSLEEDAKKILELQNQKKEKEKNKVLSYQKQQNDKLQQMKDVIDDISEKSLSLVADIRNYKSEYSIRYPNLRPSLEKIILGIQELRRKLPK